MPGSDEVRMGKLLGGGEQKGSAVSDLLAPIMSRYTNYAMTDDKIPEINSFAYMSFESAYADPLPTQRLALVLIESRIHKSSEDSALRTDLIRCLQRFKGDLRAEGLLTRFITADLYGGLVHKDGRIVLALRKFFTEVKFSFANFEGAILIGNFPEASFVRKVSWSQVGELNISSELHSERADIVMADLTGNWESLYKQEDFSSEDVSATPDDATTARGWADGESVQTCEFTSTNFKLSKTALISEMHFSSMTPFIKSSRTERHPSLSFVFV